MDLFEDQAGIGLSRPRAPLGRGSDRRSAAEWAAKRLEQEDFVILDTETSGLGPEDEVIEIGVLAPDGLVLLDVALKPVMLIDEEAAAVHHLTRERLFRATTFPAVWNALVEILAGQVVIVYNAAFDQRMLAQTCRRYGLEEIVSAREWSCAMHHYAAFVGDWNQRRQSYRWPKLQGGDHSAIGDCRATLRVLQEMARSAG